MKFIQQVEVLVDRLIIDINNIYWKVRPYIGKIRFVDDWSLTRMSKMLIIFVYKSYRYEKRTYKIVM